MRLISLALIFIFLFIQSSWAFSLSEAQGDYVRGDYESAIHKARSLEESDEVLYFLGVAYIKAAEYLQARKYLRQLIRAFPNSYLCPQGKVKLADTYFLQRDYDNAIELYRAIMKEYPSLSNMPLVLLRMAQISSRRGDWGAKKKYLSSIKAKYPQSSEMKFVKILESYGDFFTIQVGAFTSEVNALALADNLKKKYDAYVVADTNGGYSIHKVRVGHFKERYEVEKVASELSDQGYPACIYP